MNYSTKHKPFISEYNKQEGDHMCIGQLIGGSTVGTNSSFHLVLWQTIIIVFFIVIIIIVLIVIIVYIIITNSKMALLVAKSQASYSHHH